MEGMINSANEFLKNDKSGLGDAINNAGGGGEAGERKEGESPWGASRRWPGVQRGVRLWHSCQPYRPALRAGGCLRCSRAAASSRAATPLTPSPWQTTSTRPW